MSQIAINTLLIIVSVMEVAKFSIANDSGKRNLAAYETFGPVDAGGMPGRTKKVSSDLRQFLWEHWRWHRLGYATVILSSPFEFVSETTKYYVEPDKSTGKWYIQVDSEIPKQPRHPYASRRTFTAVSLECIPFDEKYDTICSSMPDGVNPPPWAYRLVLRDKDGKTIER